MASLYTHSDSNKRKTWFLMGGFFIFIILVGLAVSYYVSEAYQSPELGFIVLAIIVVVSCAMSFGSYWYSDKLVLAMSRAHELKYKDNKELYRLVENLCIAAGLPVPKIYIIQDSAPNAFATGRDPNHAVIALTTGIIQKLNRSELEGVIAHELSHIGNRDILLATVVTILVGMVVLIADVFGRSMLYGRRSSKGNNPMMFLAIFLIILSPIFAYLMKFAISRKREFKADADGALLTRYPKGLASALEKISADRDPLEVANRATAHLYISDPFKKKKRNFFTKAFMTHPPVAERIKALRGNRKPFEK